MKHLLLLLIFALSLPAARAQNTASQPTGSQNLESQFSNLKSKSNSYQEKGQTFKVVNQKMLDAFWDNVKKTMLVTEKQLADARKGTDKQLVEARQRIADQEKQLQDLKLENQQKQASIDESDKAIASISVFGMDMPKQLYVILTSVIILGLLIAMGVILSLYKSNKRIAVEKQRAFEEVDQELAEHKKLAREKELKLKRDLQTEMNKVSELNQQLTSRSK
ncbi:hypothetical protein [Pontibacter arcticus]|uniref:tRNA (Guanine-N1)-methyltransferase n=1 Tax=Pontibacter arcticus TaxID=2080288 RepID=A0A364RFE4_9BACT|nr:hypothetical protein [Pontibacter arcticus]RAU82876.1 hypothetical protein DP923_06405 [Pontibacter arcticus]